jgi:MFS family permease
VLCIGMGSGLTLVNNLSQLVKALTGGASAMDTTPVLVSAFSVCNCAGRMALGYLPERLLHARGTPRIAFLPLMSGLMAATCLGLAFAHLPALYPLSALAGFAFGGHWSLFPSLISELFGLARFAANYTLMQFAPALGAFGLAAGLAGWLYERALARHGTEGNTCVGQDCFQATFITLATLGLVATGAATVLYRRERQVYAAEYQEVHAYDLEVQRHGRQSASPSPQPH